MTNQDKTFQALQDELRRECRLEPKDRNREYEHLTLDYFREQGKRTEDHDAWRECHMHEEMLAIMNRRFMALNPHKKREAEIMQLTTKPTKEWTEEQLNALYRYEQEIDDEGRSLKELEGKFTTRDPAISRQELEVQAAENYLEETWGIKRKQAASPPLQDKINEKAASKNPNPVLSYKELQNELRKAPHSYAAIKQAVDRAIKDGKELGEQPWPIGACAAEYEIIEAEPKKGKDHPTPAACKYQKIYKEIED
jgi:hypothetical protein